MERLIICKKCGGELCYETFGYQPDESLKVWNCMGCGFTSNSYLKEGSDLQKQQEETLPELYKDLKFVDLNQNVWYPLVLNFPDKGMIFANGVSKNNWGWSAMLVTKVLEEEKSKFKKPGTKDEYYEYKMDQKTLKNFDKNDFISAAGYIGIFKEE